MPKQTAQSAVSTTSDSTKAASTFMKPATILFGLVFLVIGGGVILYIKYRSMDKQLRLLTKQVAQVPSEDDFRAAQESWAAQFQEKQAAQNTLIIARLNDLTQLVQSSQVRLNRDDDNGGTGSDAESPSPTSPDAESPSPTSPVRTSEQFTIDASNIQLVDPDVELDNDDNDMPSLAPTSQASEDVVPATQTSEDVTPASQASEDVTPASQASEDVVPATQTSEDVVPASQASEDVTPASQASEDVVPASQDPEDVVPASQASEDVTPATQTSEDVAPATQDPEVDADADASSVVIAPPMPQPRRPNAFIVQPPSDSTADEDFVSDVESTATDALESSMDLDADESDIGDDSN